MAGAWVFATSYLIAARHTAAAAVIFGVMMSVVLVMVRKALLTLDAIAVESPSRKTLVKAAPMAVCSASTAVTKSLIRSIALPHSTGAEATITGAGAGAGAGAGPGTVTVMVGPGTATVTAGPGTETVTTGPGRTKAAGAGARTLVALLAPSENPAAKNATATAGKMKRFLANHRRAGGAMTYVSMSAGR
jgi:hypothetical protein